MDDRDSPADEAPALEFSKLFALRKLGDDEERIILTADEAARARIAKRLNVPAVKALDGVITLARESDGVLLEGGLTAVVERICVASLEAFDEVIEDDFAIKFVRDLSIEDDDDLNPDAPALEPLEGDDLDLGEILVQHLSLAMAPFPRKPLGPSLAEEYGQTGEISPFAVLKGLKSDN